VAPSAAFAGQGILHTITAFAVVALLFSPYAPGQTADTKLRGCGPGETTHEVLDHGLNLVHGVEHLPRSMIRPRNLEWELPVGVATGLLIAKVDRPAANRIQSLSLQHTAQTWSDVGLFTELGVAATTWIVGCAEHKSGIRSTGLAALTAMGAATGEDLLLKITFDRQFPAQHGISSGEFWEGGHSFPSGHSAISFAFASVVAHRYPHNRLAKYGAYALAGAVAMSRYPAKRHYLSDILVGSTLGYVTGTYVAEH
jgi:membrane-associated phospholipid phosphatase